jgi:hypothetical protein
MLCGMGSFGPSPLNRRMRGLNLRIEEHGRRICEDAIWVSVTPVSCTARESRWSSKKDVLRIRASFLLSEVWNRSA